MTPVKKKETDRKYNHHFARSMELTDTALALLYKTSGDTVRAKIRYSQTALIEKMQSFVYAECAKDSVKIYSPNELNGYSVFLPGDTLNYISLDNTLNIISVFANATPFKDEKIMAGAKRIFMNCLVGGDAKLYRYITAKKALTSTYNYTQPYGPPHTTIFRETYKSSNLKYCIQIDSSGLVQLSKNNLGGFFYDCAEAKTYIASYSTGETDLIELFRIYNQWKKQTSAAATGH